jgi:hypothetical protein
MFSDLKQITNDSNKPLEVFIEPWAISVSIPPQQTCDFYADSECEGTFEIEKGDDCLVVWGWAGTNLKVTIKDEVIYDFSDFRSPILSNDMPIKKALEIILTPNVPRKKLFYFF